MNKSILYVILTSTVTSCVISSTVSIWAKSREIKVQAILTQRQEWRNILRDLLPLFFDSSSDSIENSKSSIRNKIALRLNPFDHLDKKVLNLMDDYIDNPTKEKEKEIISDFQEMLKKDWERAKIEASLFSYSASNRANKKVEKKRFNKEWNIKIFFSQILKKISICFNVL